MNKKYRITYRVECFITAKDEDEAKELFEDGDEEHAHPDYVEMVSIEEYQEEVKDEQQ